MLSFVVRLSKQYNINKVDFIVTILISALKVTKKLEHGL